MNITGVIVAGGESKRFGTPKALANLHGTPFYEYAIRALHPFVYSIIFVAHPSIQSKLHVPAYVSIINDSDRFVGEGPLAGIYSAMKMETTEWYIVLPVDAPFIHQSILQRLISHVKPGIDAVVPIVNGSTQPLIAIYSRRVVKKIEYQLVNEQRSLKSLLTQLHVTYITFTEDKPFINVNRTEDLPHDKLY